MKGAFKTAGAIADTIGGAGRSFDARQQNATQAVAKPVGETATKHGLGI